MLFNDKVNDLICSIIRYYTSASTNFYKRIIKLLNSYHVKLSTVELGLLVGFRNSEIKFVTGNKEVL